MKSAVLLIAFNRPDTLRRVLDEIRAAKPPRLYVAVDGPREHRPEDAERCAAVRRIAGGVDWDCEVKTLFRDRNLGCRLGPSSAISWFFEQEQEGIVLEDDCLPSQSFFRYCEELLEKYRDDERVFLISGSNQRDSWQPERNDYFFSNYGGIGGWAGWRRGWRFFDVDMSDLEACAESNLFENLLGKEAGRARLRALRRVKATHQDAWDYQWGFARHKNNGLACVPARSLIQNIGYGPDATHTVGGAPDDVTRHELSFPLRHNPFMVPDRRYDEYFIERRWSAAGIAREVWNRLSRKRP